MRRLSQPVVEKRPEEDAAAAAPRDVGQLVQPHALMQKCPKEREGEAFAPLPNEMKDSNTFNILAVDGTRL